MIGWAVVLFAAGMALILAEFIVPGLICGIIGSCLVIASGVVASYVYPDQIPLIILVELVGVAITIVLGILLLSKSPAGKRLIMSGEQRPEAGWVAADSDSTLVGAVGTAHTMLRPAGTIMVDGKRVDAVANGGFIEQGRAIRVLEVHGSRVVVEEAGRETGRSSR